MILRSNLSAAALRPVRDLPNQDGYEFTGVFLNGERHRCVVRQPGAGLPHQVRRVSDDTPCFFRLAGWEPLL